MKACPFLSRPRMRRNEVDLPPGMKPAPGFHLEHNPGVMCLWVTTDYKLVEAEVGRPGYLFELGEPVSLDWYSEAREATPAEINEAIAKGLPQLVGLAKRQGDDSVELLDLQLERFRELTGIKIGQGS